MIKRAVSAVLLARLEQFPAVGLLGPRQCGKTTLAMGLSRHYFDLEQPSDRLDPATYLRESAV
jgi:uncharacterized protein